MSKLIKDSNKLKLGNCLCVIQDKYTGNVRYSSGAVEKHPYLKNKNEKIVYVLHRNNERIVGYYQNKFKTKKRFKRK